MMKPFWRKKPAERVADHITQVRRFAAFEAMRKGGSPQEPTDISSHIVQENCSDKDSERRNPHSVKNPDSLAATLLKMAHEALQLGQIEEYHRLCEEAARAEGET